MTYGMRRRERDRAVFAARLAALLALVLSGVPAGSVHAQFLRGIVHGEVRDIPLSGALVELRDSTGAVVARRLTGNAGDFVFRLPAPGRWQVEARRIGFRQVLSPLVAITADTTLTLTLGSVATALPPVTARELNHCGMNTARGSATAVLWESAVTSMLSTAATLTDSSYVFDMMPSVRTYAMPEVMLLDIALRDERVRHARPWTSLPAAELAEFGYVRLVGRALEYVAPDVEVLTSPEFLATHCLRLRDDRMADGLVGIEFAPSGRVRQADIRGVLWIDRETQSLRIIDYTYVALPLVASDTLAGGRVEFSPIDGGGLIPIRWLVRSPVPPHTFVDAVAHRGIALHRAGLPVAVSALDPPLHATRVQVTGSAVQRVIRVDGTDSLAVWVRPSSVIDVLVEWTYNGVTMPAAGARVRLSGSSRQASTDLLGRVTFADLPDGDYLFEALTEVEEALRMEPERSFVSVRAGEQVSVRIPVWSPAMAVETICGVGMRGGVLVGTITQSGLPLDDISVSLWRMASAAYGRTRDTTLVDTRTDDRGRFVLCGVPRGEAFTLAARTEDGTFGVSDVLLPTWTNAPGQYVFRRDIDIRAIVPE